MEAFDYDDIQLIPNKGIIKSRRDADTSVRFGSPLCILLIEHGTHFLGKKISLLALFGVRCRLPIFLQKCLAKPKRPFVSYLTEHALSLVQKR